MSNYPPSTLETFIAAILCLLSYLTAIGALITMSLALAQTPISPFLFTVGLLLIPVSMVIYDIAENFHL